MYFISTLSSPSDPFQMHHDRMRQMMRAFPDPFAQSFTPRITDGRNRSLRGEGQSSTTPTLQHNERVSKLLCSPAVVVCQRLTSVLYTLG